MNQKQSEIQDELEALRTEKEQIDEVFEEVQLMEMSEDFDDGLGGSDEEDDGTQATDAGKGQAANVIPFKIGDAFLHVTLEQATELLEKEQKRLDEAIAAAEEEVDRCDGEMKKLKVDLYAKFGSNISKCMICSDRQSEDYSRPLRILIDLERD